MRISRFAFDGVYCELDDLIASEIKLMPMKPLCHEECKGLARFAEPTLMKVHVNVQKL